MIALFSSPPPPPPPTRTHTQEAITGLMSQVQELRVVHTTSEARVASLQQEVEDSSQELTSAAAKIDQLVSTAVK